MLGWAVGRGVVVCDNQLPRPGDAGWGQVGDIGVGVVASSAEKHKEGEHQQDNHWPFGRRARGRRLWRGWLLWIGRSHWSRQWSGHAAALLTIHPERRGGSRITR